MPFQSEKQRRYLWANEPEIARDWTDTYGSGIAKALGGRIPFGDGGFWDPNTSYIAQSPNLLGGVMQGLVNQPELTSLENQYGAGAAGNPSIARHASAASNVSDNIANFLKARSSPTPGPISEFVGDVGAWGLGAFRELEGAYRSLKGEAPWSDTWEDIKANTLGSFGTPYGKTSKDIYADVYGGKYADRFDDDDEPGTIAFDPNNPQFNKAGLGVMSLLKSKFGPKLASYLKNRALTKATNKTKAIIQQKKAAAARQAALRRQVTAQSQVNRAAGTGGWQSGMAADTGFMSGKGTSAEMGSFNRGGLAWLR